MTTTLHATGKELTKREMHIFQLIKIGLTSQEIANQLYVAKGTIDKHRKNMLKKTGAKNSIVMVGAG
jgi:DNA-binding NarL/FixJ family response regulator